MKTPLCVYILLLGLGANAFASDQMPCPEKSRGTLAEWTCFGLVEYTSKRDGQADRGARFIVFRNGERLFEGFEASAKKTMLAGKTFEIFKGLDAGDTKGAHPFQFFEFAAHAPLAALSSTKKMPGELPLGTTPLSFSGNLAGMKFESIRGTVERLAKGNYDFNAVLASAEKEPPYSLTIAITGRWSGLMVEPYPNEMAMGEWLYECKSGPEMQAQRNYRPIPPGVTLGMLRNGWKGSCD